MVASLTSINSASSRVQYFENDGYYAKDDPEHKKASNWFGRGAEFLDLAGKLVDPDVFGRVLEGEIPEKDIRLGRQRDGVREHHPGWDMGFAAPKSFSVEALVTDKSRKERRALIAIHDESVRATLAYAEANFVEARVWNPETKRTAKTATGAMAAALFRHDTSRNLDPHLHTHAVIANMTKGEDGKWRSLESTEIRRQIHLLGAYYRNELARRLLERGYRITPRPIGRMHGFEIEGFSTEQLDKVSTRRKEMEAYLDERHLPRTQRTLQIAALATRPKKIEVPRDELRRKWSKQAADYGLVSPMDLANRPRGPTEIPPLHPAELRETVELAISDVETYQSVFSSSLLQSNVLGRLAGRVRLEEIQAVIGEMESDGLLIRSVKTRSGTSYVTKATLTAEKRIVAHMRNSAGEVFAVSPSVSFDGDASLKSLTAGQREAVEAVLASTDGVMGIQGYAGVGKTTMLASLARLARERNYEVTGLAPSHASRRALEDEAGISARTLQHFLVQYSGIHRMDEEALREHRERYRKKILVVDESSMISTRQMEKLFRITEALEIEHLVLLGDSKQLRSIEAGQPFRLLQQHDMRTVVMDQILRQRDEALLNAVKAAVGGQPSVALEHLGDNLVEAEDLARSAADIYLAMAPEDRNITKIIAPTHNLREGVHEMLRETLKAEGHLTGLEITQERLISRNLKPSQMKDPYCYNPGDVVIFHHDVPVHRTKAGDHFTVTDLDGKKRVTIVDADGEQRSINPESPLRHCYEVYYRTEIRLQAGDRIRFTRNDKEREIFNGDEYTITSIDGHEMGFANDEGREISISRRSDLLKHLDHAYSSTTYSSQGTTVENVIALLDSGQGALTDQQNFYVDISRARERAVVLTDNIEALAETLEENTGERLTAMEAVGIKPLHPDPAKQGRQQDKPKDLRKPDDLERMAIASPLEAMLTGKGRAGSLATDVDLPTPDEPLRDVVEDPPVADRANDRKPEKVRADRRKGGKKERKDRGRGISGGLSP